MEQHYQKFSEQRVREVADQGRDVDLQQLTREWIEKTSDHNYTYHFEWMGRPIIQFPQDMVGMQELITRVKPDIIIETGIAHGGSLIFSASMLALLDYADASASGDVVDPANPKRKVIGVDVDIRPHNRKALDDHPMRRRIELLEGSSIDPGIVSQVQAIVTSTDTVLVCLDSNHTHDHVLAELEAYTPMVSKGSYCVVFDTVIADMDDRFFKDKPWSASRNPKTAVLEFLSKNSLFEIDDQIQSKLLISTNPQGYLRRVY